MYVLIFVLAFIFKESFFHNVLVAIGQYQKNSEFEKKKSWQDEQDPSANKRIEMDWNLKTVA